MPFSYFMLMNTSREVKIVDCTQFIRSQLRFIRSHPAVTHSHTISDTQLFLEETQSCLVVTHNHTIKHTKLCPVVTHSHTSRDTQLCVAESPA